MVGPTSWILNRAGILLPFLAHILLLTTVLAYNPLSDDFLRAIPSPGDDLDFDHGALLAPILIPRVPGTPGQLQVQQHFVTWFRQQLPEWTVEWQNSTSKTPLADKVPFYNLVFKREPPWTIRGQASLLTLAAHYDSKISPEGFIGAVDSAVPCAVLMHVARSIDGYLTKRYKEIAEMEVNESGRIPNLDMGVQIVLLDGEEAFVDWTEQDSVYGARALAEEWESDTTGATALGLFPNRINQISLFVLLDLLGAANPRIPSYFQNTHWAYRNLANIEDRMRALGLLEADPRDPFFGQADKLAKNFAKSWVGDDHVPFMRRGVPILHIIPSPFPPVWHTMRDNGQNLDMETTRDWAKIFTAFALEWLDTMDVWSESG